MKKDNLKVTDKDNVNITLMSYCDTIIIFNMEKQHQIQSSQGATNVNSNLINLSNKTAQIIKYQS